MTVQEFIDYVVNNGLQSRKIFLSGAITSRLDTYQEHFNRIAKELDKYKLNYYNPATININTSWKDSMKKTIRELLDSDIVFLLKGYEGSKGVELELKIAKALDILVIEEE